MAQYVKIDVGDPLPWFRARTAANPNFPFESLGGLYVVLCFYGTAADEAGQRMVAFGAENRGLFDEETSVFFGVGIDPADEQQGRVQPLLPGIRHFWDFDRAISRQLGAVPVDAGDGATPLRRQWIVADPMLRVHAVIPWKADGSDREQLLELLGKLPPADRLAGFRVQAPVIILPNVFEPELCDDLVARYEAHGGRESGFMREIDGRTVQVMDHRHKRRADFIVEDEEVRKLLQRRFLRRVFPEIRKVHQFEPSRMERYLVACYDGETGGHFGAHRDNTTKGTAHRRFAVSVNLNDAFDGGEVRFPEYGAQSFKPPKGGAVVFSCSLLHAVSPVTRGRRYAFLPFLYDDAAAALREENLKFVDDRVLDNRRATG